LLSFRPCMRKRPEWEQNRRAKRDHRPNDDCVKMVLCWTPFVVMEADLRKHVLMPVINTVASTQKRLWLFSTSQANPTLG